jgi:hypothetical protein
MYPIFIVLSYTGTFFGNIITMVKNCKYSHAAISTDINLDNLFSFNLIQTKGINGLSKESLRMYLEESKNGIIECMCIFVDSVTKIKIDNILNKFNQLTRKTSYSLDNVFNIYFNIPKKYDYTKHLSLVCSQFVDAVFKLVNIDLTHKPSNLVIPQDFANIRKNPKVFKLYEGLTRNYNPQKVEQDISVLFSNRNISNIRYSSKTPIDFNMITSNKGNVIECLNMIDNFLTPTRVISESNTLYTESSVEELQNMYNEIHSILSTSESDLDIESIKDQLAHLFYINSIIEKKIKHMKNGNEDYHSMIDIRKNILDDFKYYLNFVRKEDKEFNFNKYYKESQYYTDNLSTDSELFKLNGNMILKFLSNN